MHLAAVNSRLRSNTSFDLAVFLICLVEFQKENPFYVQRSFVARAIGQKILTIGCFIASFVEEGAREKRDKERRKGTKVGRECWPRRQIVEQWLRWNVHMFASKLGYI